MKILEENLSNKFEEASAELTHFKKVLAYENIYNEKNFKLLSKYAPVIIFAIWEGVFKDFIMYYYSFCNRNTKFNEDMIMLTNIIEHNQIINERYTNFDTKKKLLMKIKNVFDNPQFNEERPHIDPTKFNKTNKFLENIKLRPINMEYKSEYANLARFRNSIAHWDMDNLTEVSMDDINRYSELVIKLMSDLEENILNVI